MTPTMDIEKHHGCSPELRAQRHCGRHGKAEIICSIKAGPATATAKKVIWSRGDAGRWTCAMDGIKRKYATAACPVNTWGIIPCGARASSPIQAPCRQPSIAACQSPGLPPCFSSTRVRPPCTCHKLSAGRTGRQ
ncbi:pilin [Massilia frigida]|uniref:pilin n=1 Tax=Massilia frigida TaxID=2609281 RepID=UPI00351D65CB